jgi:zinc/manganese transport system substrate-binding protein
MYRPLLLLAVAVLACAADRIPTVVCGSSVVHDLVRQVGGSRIQAVSLIPPGVDAHAFQPKPEDAKLLQAADLLVVNGLGFEGWYEKLVADASFPKDRIVVAAAGVTPLTMEEGDHDHHGHDHGHAHTEDGGVADPHAFGDVRNVMRYVENIRDGLIRLEPKGEAEFRLLADLQLAELRALDGWVKKTLARIPAAQRVVITNHDAMQYFAKAYGFEVRAPNTMFEDSQPSAKQVADLVAFLKGQQVKAVFIEYAKNPKLMEQIAGEAGVALGRPLFLDSVPPAGHPWTGYRGMVVSNVLALTAALQ